MRGNQSIRAPRVRLGLTIAPLCALLSAGCGGGDDDGGGQQDGGMEGDGVAGTARILKGPSGAAAFTSGGPSQAAADGHWYITPQEAELNLVDVTFSGTDGHVSSSPLTDCTPAYQEGDETLAPILDCPFTVAPGTYNVVSIGVSTTAQVLIADAENEIYSDPESPTGLSPTEPAGGPAASTLTVPGPGGGEGDVLTQGAFLDPPLVVEDTAVVVSIVQDMIHTVFVDVSNGGSELEYDDSLPQAPALLMPSVEGAGRVEFYSPSLDSTAGNYFQGPGGTGSEAGTVRLFYPSQTGQPSILWHVVLGPSQANATSPEVSPQGPGGERAGGFLGVDDNGDACWALPTDATYATYSRVCVMHLVDSIGAETTLDCEMTETAPLPVSGNTYASGCPTITPDTSTPMKLIGR